MFQNVFIQICIFKEDEFNEHNGQYKSNTILFIKKSKFLLYKNREGVVAHNARLPT